MTERGFIRKLTLPNNLAQQRLEAGVVSYEIKMGTVYGTSTYASTKVHSKNSAVTGGINSIGSTTAHHLQFWIRPTDNGKSIEIKLVDNDFGVADGQSIAVLSVAAKNNAGTIENIDCYALYNLENGKSLVLEHIDADGLVNEASVFTPISKQVAKLAELVKSSNTKSIETKQTLTKLIGSPVIGLVIGAVFHSFLAGIVSAIAAFFLVDKLFPSAPYANDQIRDHLRKLHETLLESLKAQS